MSQLFRVIIAGTRTYADYAFLCSKCDALLSEKARTHDIEIVSGMANGADKLGVRYAKERGYAIKEFPADWNAFGKSAGFRRNKDMAEYADAAVIFNVNHSRGSTMMEDLARKHGLPVRVYRL